MNNRIECPGTPITRMFEQIPQGSRTDFLLQSLSSNLVSQPRQYVHYPSWWGDGHIEKPVLTIKSSNDSQHDRRKNSSSSESKHESSTQTDHSRIDDSFTADRIYSLHDVESEPRKRDFFTTTATLTPPHTRTPVSRVQNAVNSNSARKKMLQKSHDVSEPVQYARVSSRPAMNRSPPRKERVRVGVSESRVPKAHTQKEARGEDLKMYDSEGIEKVQYHMKIMDIVHNFLGSELLGALDLGVLDDE